MARSVMSAMLQNPSMAAKSILKSRGWNRQVMRSIAAVFSGNMSASVLGAFGGLLAARFLGPEDTGHYRAFTIPLTYLTCLHLGTFDGLWRQIPFFIGKEEHEKVNRIAAVSGAWNIIISLIASTTFLILSLSALIRHNYPAAGAWAAQMLFAWSIYYGGYLGATYRTINQFAAQAKIQFIQATLTFAAVFTMPFLGFYGICIRSSVPAVMGIALLHRRRPLKVRYRLDWKELWGVVRIGAPFTLWGSLSTSIWTATESTLMYRFGGAKGLGLFAVAVLMRETLAILPQAVNQVLTPRVVETYAREGCLRKANNKAITTTFALTGAMVILTVLLSILIQFMVPRAIPKYVEGIHLMQICLWVAVLQAASLPFNTLFATGRSWLYGRGVILGLLCFPISTYLLAPLTGGMVAVAVGSLIGRAARILVAYGEIALLIRREAA